MSTQETNLKAIADAIREKEGSSAPIPAKDFAQRIRALEIGIPPVDLPSGYTQLRYIQTNYYTSISTGLPLTTDTTRIVMDIEPIYVNDASAIIFIAYYQSNTISGTPMINIVKAENSNELTLYSGLGGNYGKAINSGYKLSQFDRIKIDFDTLNKTLKINEVPIVFDPSSIVGSGTYLGNNGYFGYWRHNNLFSGYAMIIKIYSVKVYINNDLFGNYVPCKNSSGKVGLYNTVSKVFQTNVNTSSNSEPVAGPVV